jgi:SAM-dependent methyltransferase
MDWVKTFYSKQNEWFGIYLGEIESTHLKKADLVQDYSPIKQNAEILELGAGGGQTAASIANKGHNVTMIELLEDSVECAEGLASNLKKGNLNVILGDFYEIELEPKYDLICYFDSFGIGSDNDQKVLLKRIASWLNPKGIAIIEIGSTWFWAQRHGLEIDLGAGFRKYEFDYIESRLLDFWWLPENPDEKYFQSLRCYTPADFKLLLEGTGLVLKEIKAGGTIDFDNFEFVENANLSEAMTYFVVLSKSDFYHSE